MRHSLLSTSLRGYAVVIGVLGILAPLLILGGLRPVLVELALDDLSRAAVSTREALSGAVLSGDLPGADSIASVIDRETGMRVTLISPNGGILLDTRVDPDSMEGHRTRIEVISALKSGSGTAVRSSSTLEADMLYAASSIESNGAPVAVVRVSIPFQHLKGLMSGIGIRTAVLAAVAVMLSAILACIYSRSIAGPVRRLADCFSRMKAGDFAVRAGPSRIAELDILAGGFNEAAATTGKLVDDLSERTSQFHAILESAAGPITVLDGTGRFVYANAAFRALGAVDSMEGCDYREVISDPELLTALGAAMGSRGSGCGRIAEGSRTWAYSFTGVSGQDQIVFSLANITEMANLAATKRDFAVNVAHELRTPLTAIKGFAETLAERAAGEDARFVKTILRNTERLISLVRDVQTLAQLENPVSEPEVRPVDLNGLISTILELFRSAASKKGLDLLFEPAKVAPVAGDSFRLEQVLINLLDNAVKYTDKGVVKISLREEAEMAAVEISDTGQGIPAGEIPRLCERFYVVDKSRSRSLGGTGLGLAIVKHILMLHGGSLDIKSEMGRGSVFTIRLPLFRDSRPS